MSARGEEDFARSYDCHRWSTAAVRSDVVYPLGEVELGKHGVVAVFQLANIGRVPRTHTLQL